ncbi:uncharacterized protein LOC109813173 [Cajanus cajan]|uniref:uncharacterized protein LOC109813173 n=1 Tax=Cajanus cajan TaxID=3821 RepID=UPI00098D7873|nr:uncharacterized protein LOC109813173 [Cajanus cajan]
MAITEFPALVEKAKVVERLESVGKPAKTIGGPVVVLVIKGSLMTGPNNKGVLPQGNLMRELRVTLRLLDVIGVVGHILAETALLHSLGVLGVANCARRELLFPQLEDDVLLSAGQAEQLMGDGAECFMLFAALSVETERAITGIKIVNEFPEVFPNDVLGLPPMRDVEFSIDLVPGAGTVSVAPYRMALAKLVELKKQIEELLEK